MKINAYAKINLGLDVLARRADGYHEVRMIMQTIGICDELDIIKTDEPGISITSNREDLPVNEDNLIYKAAALIIDEYDIKGGIKVSLTKNIPVAAGLAGGSTDAATVLKAVNELYGLGLSQDDLMKLGVRIGADVPYCIMGGTALSCGIGEILTPLCPCPKCRLIIAKPDISISTAKVYKALKLENVKHPDIDAIMRGIENGDIKEVADNMGNVLETVTVAGNPVINDIKKIMKDNGSIGALMSGSGPTVFGLFGSGEDTDAAFECLKQSGLAPELFITEIYNEHR